MRPAFSWPRSAFLAGLLTLGACVHEAPPEHTFAVFYQNFSTTLDDSGRVVVTRAAAISKRFPSLPVTVSGYADPSDTNATGVHLLAEARVNAVTQQLLAEGVSSALIIRKPIGVPVGSQPGVESRRVEIDIGNP